MRKHTFRRISVAALMSIVILAACEDPAGLEDEQKADDEPSPDYNLVEVNGRALPAIAVEGSCWNPLLLFAFAPDTIRIDGGGLTLKNGRYEVYYMWRGETDLCTITHSHWHRISAGTYSNSGDAIVFVEGAEPDHWPTSNRSGSPGRPTAIRTGSSVLVSWGALKLRYAARGG